MTAHFFKNSGKAAALALLSAAFLSAAPTAAHAGWQATPVDGSGSSRAVSSPIPVSLAAGGTYCQKNTATSDISVSIVGKSLVLYFYNASNISGTGPSFIFTDGFLMGQTPSTGGSVQAAIPVSTGFCVANASTATATFLVSALANSTVTAPVSTTTQAVGTPSAIDTTASGSPRYTIDQSNLATKVQAILQ